MYRELTPRKKLQKKSNKKTQARKISVSKFNVQRSHA